MVMTIDEAIHEIQWRQKHGATRESECVLLRAYLKLEEQLAEMEENKRDSEGGRVVREVQVIH